VIGLGGVAVTSVLAWFPAVALLFKPGRLEISPSGLRRETAWGIREWSWNEIRHITVIKIRALGNWSSGVCFTRYTADPYSEGPARPMLRPIWTVSADELATLLNEARVRWSSGTGDHYLPARTRLIDHAVQFLILASVGAMLWIFIGRPCGL
jgi:hypothetical protein